MDRILQGLFDSNHPDILKEKFLQKILKSPKTAQHTIPVLNLAVRVSLDGETAFHCTSGVRLYENWAKNNEEIFQNYFTVEFMRDILINPHQNPTAAIVIIEKSLKILKNTECYASLVKYFQQFITPFLRQNCNLLCLDLVFCLLTKQPECIPVHQRYEFCCVIIDILYAAKAPKQGIDFSREFQTINTAGKILKELWEDCNPNISNSDTWKKSIHYLFSLISQPFDTPSVCLGTLGQIPSKSVEEIIDSVNIDIIEKHKVFNAIDQILHWLDGPFSQQVHIWINGIFDKLALAGYNDVLVEIAQENIVFITSMLKPIASRESAAKILVYIYMKIQMKPQSICQMIMELIKIIPILTEEKSNTGLACIEILLANMELEIHWHCKEPYIKYRQNYFSIKELQLNEGKLCNASNKKFTISPLAAKKILSRKTGLCNVKNSCYMNSIIQVLFMLDDFRHEVLALSVPPGSIISRLQEVFSYLLSSSRPAFYPSEFYSIANPSWFAKYEQQDCAEFLSHLLNSFDEEEKKTMKSLSDSSEETLNNKNEKKMKKHQLVESKSKTLTDKKFFGKLRNFNKCLKCQTKTKHEERFSFLLLSLPSDDTEEEEEKEANQKNDKLDIRDLIANYFTEEKLTISNQFMCSKCEDYRDGIRQAFLVEAPEYLNLTLSRFAYNRKNKKRSKIMTEVHYPKELELKRLISYDEGSIVEEDVNYVLCSVVIHSGYSSDSGHCTLLSQHSCLINEHYSSPSDLLKDKWYIFNDESVTETKFNFSETMKSSKSETPYFFIYRRVTKELLDSGDLCSNLEELLEKSIIPTRFQNDISKDNERYVKENVSQLKEEDSKKKKKDDFDYDGNSGNNGGTNAFGHLDIFGSKFIY